MNSIPYASSIETRGRSFTIDPLKIIRLQGFEGAERREITRHDCSLAAQDEESLTEPLSLNPLE
jgi:hypothetical protein